MLHLRAQPCGSPAIPGTVSELQMQKYELCKAAGILVSDSWAFSSSKARHEKGNRGLLRLPRYYQLQSLESKDNHIWGKSIKGSNNVHCVATFRNPESTELMIAEAEWR